MLLFVALLMPVCSESTDENFSRSARVLVQCEFMCTTCVQLSFEARDSLIPLYWSYRQL